MSRGYLIAFQIDFVVEMTFVQSMLPAVSSHPALFLLLGIPVLVRILYRLYYHPLSHVPGPLTARITWLHLYIICYLGVECRLLRRYHQKYNTPVLRIAPNAVSISDGAALHPIYIANGGFTKSARYENFKVGGLHTIFSSRDTAYRDVRAKAVAPLFAMGRVRAAGEASGTIGESIEKFLRLFEREKADATRRKPTNAEVDILDLAYRLMMDLVTGYLFGQTYGALEERNLAAKSASACSVDSGQMSALPFIFAIVEAGRFSLLPPRIFNFIHAAFHQFFPNYEFQNSLDRVHAFAADITENANSEENDTYQSRLLASGVSKQETILQCMAVMFAGTDSTAVKLVAIIFHLVQNPEVHERLRRELEVATKDGVADLQTLPYLRATVREGLRLGMANPARFSRMVPHGGFETNGIYLPEGTDVGLAPYVLHHNPELFPKPFEFHPERWLDGGEGRLLWPKTHLREMERDLIPFSVGSRQCIARNLATYELFLVTKAIVESRILEGGRTCTKIIPLEEYFNVEIKSHKLKIEWSHYI